MRERVILLVCRREVVRLVSSAAGGVRFLSMRMPEAPPPTGQLTVTWESCDAPSLYGSSDHSATGPTG